MEQLKFMEKRLVYLVVMLFGVVTLVFVLMKMIPGDSAVANSSQRTLNDPEIVATYRAKHSLDQPLSMQYILYMKNFLQFDLGTSMRTDKPVLSEPARRYPVIIEPALFIIVTAVILGVLFGIISTVRRNSTLDQTVWAIPVIGVNIPSFQSVLLMLYFSYYKLKLSPDSGRLSNAFTMLATITGVYVINSLLEEDISKALDAASHLILPGAVFAIFTMGLAARIARSNLLDVMSTDYIRTVKAEGLSRPELIIRHAPGNALTPVLTIIGLGPDNLLGGMVLVETIFSWLGVGQFAYGSVLSMDFLSTIGVALLVALNYMVINIAVNTLYGIIDPRVRCG